MKADFSYKIFANYYDILTENIDYTQICNYYLDILYSNGIESGKILDLACGTGNLSIELVKQKDFSITATDLSAEMLSFASAKIGFDNARFLQLDMRKLPFHDEFDAILCTLDSLNHLENKSDLENTFRAVNDSLKTGGIFAFDMNSIFKHREILGFNTFVYDTEGVFCTWQNEYSPENSRVDISLDFFVLDDKNLYKRYQEFFAETAYSINEICEILTRNNFVVLNDYEYLTKNKADENSSEKYTIIARKV